jgi:hypothetical protein
LKRRFKILQGAPEYDMDIQVLIPPALAALHNFIRQYDPDDIDLDADDPPNFQMDSDPEFTGELGEGPATSSERARANERRDGIAAAMWEQYQDYLGTHRR